MRLENYNSIPPARGEEQERDGNMKEKDLKNNVYYQDYIILGINQVEEACGDFITMYCQECGQKHHVHLGCGKRTCQNCARKRVRRLFKEFIKIVQNWKYKSHVVLTRRREPYEDLREAVKEIKEAWRRFKRVRIKLKDLTEEKRKEIEQEIIRRRLKKRRTVGIELMENAIGVIETKPERDGWHVHIHLIVNSRWFPQWFLSDLWALATGGNGYITYIRRVWRKGGEKAVKKVVWEVVKYILKISKMREERKREFEAKLKNVSLIVKYNVSSVHNDIEIDEQVLEGLRCQVCGGKLIIIKELSERISKEELLEKILQREKRKIVNDDEPF